MTALLIPDAATTPARTEAGGPICPTWCFCQHAATPATPGEGGARS